MQKILIFDIDTNHAKLGHYNNHNSELQDVTEEYDVIQGSEVRIMGNCAISFAQNCELGIQDYA